MTFQEITYPIDLLNYGPPRTPGLHLSHILRAMAIHTKVFKEDSVELEDLMSDPHAVGKSGTLMRIIQGYAWEEWLAKNVLKNVRFHPGEFILDGIIGTPDGLEEDDRWITVHETKWTFKSSSGQFSKHLYWLYQGCGYVKMVSEAMGASIDQCRLIFHPCYVKGNYKGIDTEYRPVEVHLTEREVNGVWEEISKHRNLVS